jgi:putrescine transport system substrate-binding protein
LGLPPEIRMFRIPSFCLSLCGVLIVACGCSNHTPTTGAGPRAAGEPKALNLSIWSAYLAPGTVASFEKETGIDVSVTNYASNEELEGMLSVGHSGYDVVVPSASFYQRQIRHGFYRKLDKSRLPNLANMDPQILERMAIHDPGNQYAVLLAWGTYGIGYNVDKVEAAAPNAPLDTMQLVFDPTYAKQLKKCGIAMLESSKEMFDMALQAIGRDPNRKTPADLEAAVAALMKIRPYIRYVHTAEIIPDLANGEICVAIGYIGDFLQARDRAAESNTGQKISYFIPREGSVLWFDSFLIPADAPHPANAHAFLNYMLRPDVMAAVTSYNHYANGNRKATPLVAGSVRNEPGVYPPPEVRARLIPTVADSEESLRMMTRLWTKFMTGT